MKKHKILLIALLVTGFVFSGFSLVSDPGDRLRSIARDYQKYTFHRNVDIVVTDSSRYKWTIALCRTPKNTEMGWHRKIDSSFFSKANAAISPHGNKLYQLYVKEYGPYKRNPPIGQPIGQVIVKETWNVKEVVYDSSNKWITQIQSRNDGKWYTPVSVSELFIMYKEENKLTNDKGWVYGSVSIENPEQKPVVLNNVKTSNCISCHAGTKYDRIFGVE